MHYGNSDRRRPRAKNLIITGFMGTGKTVVGQMVAEQLGLPLVDMDAEIEARAGKSIPRIFAEDGEAAFRQREAELCRELAARQGLVIATGGGALVDTSNRALMMQSGTVVCLACGEDEILRRLQAGGAQERPLLGVADPRAEMARLLAARKAAYQSFPWQIDTTSSSVAAVAAQVAAFAGVITLPVRYPGGSYDIHIGLGLLEQVGSALRAAGAPQGSRVGLVSNTVVAPFYGARVETALQAAGFGSFACVIPDGETHKRLDTVATLYEQFLAGGLDRGGTVLALGGGVTGDVAGFAAASFMRGVRFAQVPTTLLAMTDASVGAKTGVNLPQGKNLVGAFKQPAAVIIDPSVLATLAPQEFRSGLAEVIKNSVIGAPDLFQELETTIVNCQSPIPLSTSQIARSLQVKLEIVQEDPYEEGRRAVLNLGHTVGHALERLGDFSLRHGEAVSIGMVVAGWVAVELGWAPPALAERLEGLLAACGLPTSLPPYSAERVWDAMAHDKKRHGQRLRWILPRAIGQVDITDAVSQDLVVRVLRARSKE